MSASETGEEMMIKIMIKIKITISGCAARRTVSNFPGGCKENCGQDEVLLHNLASAFGPEH
jgi:hypothetical protein